ncbi:MAG: Slp family lipoprotein [Nitrospiraceae bacterium]
MKRKHPCRTSFSWRDALVVGLIALLSGCHALPSKYTKQAEPGVTLTTLAADPDKYRGKVVILGGVLIEDRLVREAHWMRLRNRPLDQDYEPHRPTSSDDPEAGYYWVMVANQKEFPEMSRKWARMTVVGRVLGTKDQHSKEPLLGLIYVRGWGLSGSHDGAWEETLDPNYLLSVPAGVHGELGAQ